MNGHFWREFYLTAHNPVFEHGQPYVDLSLFDQEKYPALKILKHQSSTLEILILGQLILDAENDDPQDCYCSETNMEGYFENYDCTNADILKALYNLQRKNWIEIFIDEADYLLYYKANLTQLIADKIYTSNKWRNLFRLGLYGSKICKN